MSANRKLTEDLTAGDLRAHPVWEYVMDDPDALETVVQPVADLPVRDLGGRLVGIQVRLRNGDRHWAICSNISLGSPIATRHFLCLWIEKDGQWFSLARYHDSDFERRSPAKLGEFLGLAPEDVFPIEYDISDIAVGNQAVVWGLIPEMPEEVLEEGELIELALTTED